MLGTERLNYPDRHIEIDNRLAWFIGRLDRDIGDAAEYVWLRRRPEEVARSYNKRWHKSLVPAYAKGLLSHNMAIENGMDVCRDLVDTIESSIALYLKNHPYLEVWLHDPEPSFRKFWKKIGAEGDLDKALDEWTKRRNATLK